MNKVEFTEWLQETKKYSSQKLISDCVSRVTRVEKAFAQSNPKFISLDAEYKKNKCRYVLDAISHFGKGESMKRFLPTTLPVGTRHFCVIGCAVKTYIKFLEERSNK